MSGVTDSNYFKIGAPIGSFIAGVLTGMGISKLIAKRTSRKTTNQPELITVKDDQVGVPSRGNNSKLIVLSTKNNNLINDLPTIHKEKEWKAPPNFDEEAFQELQKMVQVLGSQK